MISTLSMLSQSWTQVTTASVNATVNSLYTDASVNKLYATGAFTGKVAYLSGSTWNVISGYTGTAGNSILSYSSFMVPQQTIIVCADKIYSYETGAWSTRSNIGNYTASCVDSLTDYLYVAGLTGTTYKIFKYDLTDLAVVSGTLTPVATYTNANFSTASGKITDLEILNNVLYIGLENSGSSLMQIDLTTNLVSTVGTQSAFNANVKCLTVNSNLLYASGNFAGYAGPSTNLTSYNGSSFNSYSGINNTLGQHIKFNSNLYVVHNTAAGVGMTSNIEVMTSTSTSTLVSSATSTLVLNNTQTVNTMAVYNGELYIGGSLVVSTGSSSFSNIAKYSTSIPTGISELNKTNSTLVYPNPSTGIVNVITEENSNVLVLNNLGQIVLQFTANSKVSNINIQNAGIYTVQISKNNQVSNSRLIIQ